MLFILQDRVKHAMDLAGRHLVMQEFVDFLGGASPFLFFVCFVCVDITGFSLPPLIL